MPRSLATVTIAFGLVAIPVRLYSTIQRGTTLRFRWMTTEGATVRQHLVADTPEVNASDGDSSLGSGAMMAAGATSPSWRALTSESNPTVDRWAESAESTPPVRAGRDVEEADSGERAPDLTGSDSRIRPVARSALQKGLEIEPGRFVLFTPAELEALATPKRDSIDLVGFVPPHAVDPVYVEKSYFLAPAPRGERPYALLLRAMQVTQRCALARWAWRGREHPALLRSGDGVIVLHQLHSGDAVRKASELDVDLMDVTKPELDLAVRLVENTAMDSFDPLQFIDPARQRILDAARRKLEGGEAIETRPSEPSLPSGEIVDLLAALRASLSEPKHLVRRPPRKASAPLAAPATRRGTQRRGRA